MNTILNSSIEGSVLYINQRISKDIKEITIIDEEVSSSDDIKTLIDKIKTIETLDSLYINKMKLDVIDSHDFFCKLSNLKNICNLKIMINPGNYLFSNTFDHYWFFFFLGNSEKLQSIIFIGDLAPKQYKEMSLTHIVTNIVTNFLEKSAPSTRLSIRYPLPLDAFCSFVANFNNEKIDKEMMLALWLERNKEVKYLSLCLKYAIKVNDVDTMICLISNGADVNYCDEDSGLSLLSLAAGCGNVEAIKCLIDHGAEVNKPIKHYLLNDKSSSCSIDITAIVCAFSAARVESVKELISNGANLEQNEKVNSVFYIFRHPHLFISDKIASFAYSGDERIEIVKYLIEQNKLKINDPVWYFKGMSMLHLAARNWDFFMVKELILLGADVNVKDKFGNTPLHIAAYQLNCNSIDDCIITKDKIICLIRNKADITINNDQGVSSFEKILDFAKSNIEWIRESEELHDFFKIFIKKDENTQEKPKEKITYKK